MEIEKPTVDDVLTIVKDLYLRIKVTRNLVYEGKVCPAYERLQGIMTKCGALLLAVNKMREQNVEQLAPQIDQPCQAKLSSQSART